jgi:hypothetical protein
MSGRIPSLGLSPGYFRRHTGTADAKDVVRYLRELDHKRDRWVVAYIGAELSPSEVEGMGPAEAAEPLMCFANVRKRLRP